MRLRRILPYAIPLALPVVFWLAAKATREIEVHSRDSVIGPGGTAYALRLSPHALRVDRLPCGDMFAPRPIEFPSPIRDVAWPDSRTLRVTLEAPIPKSVSLPRVVAGFRLVTVAL